MTENRAVLVAGGAGYIGSHICKMLSVHGYLPVVLDNFSTGHIEFCRFGELVRASVGEANAVRQAIDK